MRLEAGVGQIGQVKARVDALSFAMVNKGTASNAAFQPVVLWVAVGLLATSLGHPPYRPLKQHWPFQKG